MDKRATFFLVIGIILITGIYSFAKSQKEAVPSAPLVLEKVFEFNVKNNKLVSGPDTLKVTEGDAVTFIITTDDEDELHLHGYDLSIELSKELPSELSFTANKTGRFEFELEHSKLTLGAIEVFPK